MKTPHIVATVSTGERNLQSGHIMLKLRVYILFWGTLSAVEVVNRAALAGPGVSPEQLSLSASM